MQPAATNAVSRPGNGPMTGLPSGENTIPPFTMRLTPALLMTGMRCIIFSRGPAIRSMSGGNSSIPKSCGVPSIAQWRQSCS
jgi:hypothetical protein